MTGVPACGVLGKPPERARSAARARTAGPECLSMSETMLRPAERPPGESVPLLHR